jgi:nitrogen-specific signal transduction histidine kinase
MDTQKTEHLPGPLLTRDALQSELSGLHHKLNNPLAVISGNVQLLKELAAALSVADDLGGPLEDIALAVDQLASGTDRLILLRDILKKESD